MPYGSLESAKNGDASFKPWTAVAASSAVVICLSILAIRCGGRYKVDGEASTT